jgi:MIP family channel proteins
MARLVQPSLAQRAGAEVLGTFALVFAGCGAIVTNAQHPGSLGGVGISLVFGLVILAGIAAFGHISGAHFNPAVTTSFLLTRHLPGRDAGTYIGAQLLGATLAALLLWVVWPAQPADLGATLPTIAAGRAFIVEAVMSGLLMLVILSVATDTRAAGAPAAIAIGATIALDALFGGPLTGASMNPARSFAPALVSGQWHDFWIYLAGPLVGAPLGAYAYQLVRGEQPQPAMAQVPERLPGQHTQPPVQTTVGQS